MLRLSPPPAVQSVLRRWRARRPFAILILAAVGAGLLALTPSSQAASGNSNKSLTAKQTFKAPVKAPPPIPFETTAPEFALSGRSGELEKVILAQSPSGPITALDVLLFDQMTDQRLWATPISAFLDPKSLEAENDLQAIRDGVDRLVAAQSLASRAGGWAPPEDELRVMTYPAAEAAWIDLTIVPQVKIEEADIHRYYLEHANDYLRRRQTQVRYIFKRVDLKDSEKTAAARQALDSAAVAVRQGTRDFADAARELSDAASKADGGLIPPFFDSKYFPAFDQNAFSLNQPGDLSPIFEGPGGLYLVQLVKTFPTVNIPIEAVHDTIAVDLAHEHVRHYYAYAVTKLKEDASDRDFSPWWPYLNADAPIALIGDRKLSRQDFIRYFGNPTELDYSVRWDLVGAGAKTWMEGELILDALAKAGGAQHRWLARGRQLATIALRARRTLAGEVPPASYASAAAATATLQASDVLANDFKSYHLLQFQIDLQRDDKMTASDQRAAERLAETLEDQIRNGTVPVEPAPVALTEWSDDALTSGGLNLKPSIDKLNKLAAATKWEHVRLRVTDFGWVSPLPDSPMHQLLAGVGTLEFSRTQEIGTLRQLYLALETKPALAETWKGHPEVLRELAYQAGALKLRAAERDRLAAQGAIRYQF